MQILKHHGYNLCITDKGNWFIISPKKAKIMNKLLSLMHDTAGKLNRIKANTTDFKKEIEKTHPDFLTKPLEANKNLKMSIFLDDTLYQVQEIQAVLDKFYVDNKIV